MQDHQKNNSKKYQNNALDLEANKQVLQRQKLQEIGANLFSIRTAKGWELDEIVAKTQITKRVLVAIEQGHIENLPESFYTKALIKKYANVLGVADVTDYTAVALEATTTAKSSQKLDFGRYFPKWELPKWQLRSRHLYLLYLILVGVAVKGIATVVDNPSRTEKPILFTETEVSQTTSTSIPNSSSPNSTSQLVTESNTTISDSVVVDVSVKELCWLKVVVDRKVEFEGMLNAGTNRSWTGKETVTIVAGNAGGIVVTYNKGQGKILGEPGEVEEVTYTLN